MVSLDEIGQRVDFLSGHGCAALDIDTADRTACIDRATEDLEFGITDCVGEVL